MGDKTISPCWNISQKTVLLSENRKKGTTTSTNKTHTKTSQDDHDYSAEAAEISSAVMQTSNLAFIEEWQEKSQCW